jgi:hypothetical protein
MAAPKPSRKKLAVLATIECRENFYLRHYHGRIRWCTDKHYICRQLYQLCEDQRLCSPKLAQDHVGEECGTDEANSVADEYQGHDRV